MEARLLQTRGDDAPDQPHRKADVLGEDGPNEVAPSDALAFRIPELCIVGLPIGDPVLARSAHDFLPLKNSLAMFPVLLWICFSIVALAERLLVQNANGMSSWTIL